VLKFAGIDINDPKIHHVQFEGADHGADGNPYGEYRSPIMIKIWMAYLCQCW
jgi:hypothetical protein